MCATCFDMYFMPSSGMSTQNSYKERCNKIESEGPMFMVTVYYDVKI